ncbi:hypothetical protein F0562_005314 [Nyssa sinensis]|uniref:Protein DETOXIFICATION n=1 Tax=Nyssa sinensis TaxID=561372 RepID=A0A5J5AHQ9_9ASTE|nr:hypothetical protein F0562_005314 [Nyssa sinensis]
MEEVTTAEIRGERSWRVTWGTVFMQELKKTSYIAAPTVAATVMQYLMQVISVMMVGHLGQLSLSSVAIATSLTNATGFSLLKHRCVYGRGDNGRDQGREELEGNMGYYLYARAEEDELHSGTNGGSHRDAVPLASHIGDDGRAPWSALTL